MNRGKRFGNYGKFHSYQKQDKRNCSRGNCDLPKNSYALQESIRRRQERDERIQLNPTELGRDRMSWRRDLF